jgi:glyoxylase-like metal-dependent hydrolase (beta-lactamase superfamily II)
MLSILILIASPVARASDSPAIRVTELTDDLYLLATDQGSYTTNSLLFVGADGLLLVDTQSEDDAEELERAVEELGKARPAYIINTHRHVEHIGGNAIFGEEPVVIAHSLVPEKLRTGSHIFDEFPDATFPDITFDTSLTLHFNDERIELHALAGSHDDNEIIVHFTKARVVHLSSLVNGFNFPSVDSDGDVLKFPELVARAMEMLPRDVTIVSGHNDIGTWEDLRAYHQMLVQTTQIVRDGLSEGYDVIELQKREVLGEWGRYAGSYVSVDDWIKYLARGIEGKDETKKSVFEPIYRTWKHEGAESAVEHYFTLKRNHSEEYGFGGFVLLEIGDKLSRRGHTEAAIPFLEADLADQPDSKYRYYTAYKLADAYHKVGKEELALDYCEMALDLNPEFAPAVALRATLEEE